MIVAKSETIQVTKGNTRGRVKENTKTDAHDERQLPQRQKKFFSVENNINIINGYYFLSNVSRYLLNISLQRVIIVY